MHVLIGISQADDIVPNNRPPPNWPNEGRIQFDRYSTRYREDLQLVLKDIVANIPGKQKVRGFTNKHGHNHMYIHVCVLLPPLRLVL